MRNDRKIIMHIDMNSFFASAEQCANPFIRNKPIGVSSSPGYKNAALVAISIEAKKRGLGKMSRLQDAKDIVPDLIAVPFDPLKYYAINREIIRIISDYSPKVEVYSIDEAFVDFTDSKKIDWEVVEEIAREIKVRILEEIGPKLTCSVGIANNKLMAKVASNWKKPDGLATIKWEERFEYLDKLKPGDIWGIGRNATPKLDKLGISSTKQIREMDDTTLSSIVGSYYNRLRLIANGENYEEVETPGNKKPAKTMQHAHTMSKSTNDIDELLNLTRKLSEKLATRLRKYEQFANNVYVQLRAENSELGYGWGSVPFFSDFATTINPTQDGKDIYESAKSIITNFQIKNKIRQVAIGVSSLTSQNQLFFDVYNHQNKSKLNGAIDEINSEFGDFMIRPASLVGNNTKHRKIKVDHTDMKFHPAAF